MTFLPMLIVFLQCLKASWDQVRSIQKMVMCDPKDGKGNAISEGLINSIYLNFEGISLERARNGPFVGYIKSISSFDNFTFESSVFLIKSL
jgi:hypothetical protein